MNSADSWHESNGKPWPQDPEGDLAPILAASITLIEELRAASMARHPSARGNDMPTLTLTAYDRCDQCGAAAAIRVTKEETKGMTLELCRHHYRRNKQKLTDEGWLIVGGDGSEAHA